MIESNAAALRDKFEDSSRRLQARSAEFQQSGEFLDIHRSLLREIKQRHDQLAAKLADAQLRGDTAALVNAELAHDFNALLEQFLLMQERVDGDAMKMAGRK